MPAPFPAYYLVSGDGHRWGAETGAAVGSPVTVTFSFPTALAPNLQKDFSGWTKFNPVQEAATRKALAYIESFTNIKFVEVAANTGKLQFDNTNLGPGMGGQAPHAVWGGAGGIEFAHVVMNNAAGWRLDNQAYVPGEISTADTGGAAWQTLIHEIAHTLGLKHPHDLNDARDPGSIRPAATDDFTVSTMSYTAYKNAMVTATGRHADGSQYSLTNTLKPQTFGMDDIAALQYLYGMNTSSKGNNTYVFKPDQPVFMTISDNGPNNTIDVSALTGSNTIYLSGGSFSNLAIKQNLPAASVKGDTYNGTHALAIAYSAKVANVIGGSGDDAIAGNELANTLYGRNGNDQLIGGDGTDTLYGGLGADRLVGDHGFDYARYDDANYGNLIISLTDPSKNTGAAKGDTYEWVEGIVGGVGNDTITGDAGINVLRGGAGNDALNGGAGADTLEGGAGNDTFFVDNTGDKVVEGVNGGIDKVVASVTVTLAANVENLTLTGKAAINGSGNGLANVITGNAGNNLLNGAAGADTLSGGLGDDRYVVDNVGDRVVEAAKAGTDTVQASVTVTLAANVENLTLTGKAAIDGTGNALANLIVGNNGNNVLAGGLGNDSLTGGAGKDSFVFNTTLGATNIDMIKSFSAADDTIRLDDAVFKGLALGTLSANALSIGTVDVAADASDRIIYNTKTGRLFYDADGTGAQKAVAFATLDTHPSLTFQDFLVV